ncbi:MAG: hypothetical protein ACMVO5_02265 [Polymorphobacter sp.]|uniref:hypothetical protein n=1 Tax=Polymorphobacter sp. TaxID=1909290 RepID=UPI003A837B41
MEHPFPVRDRQLEYYTLFDQRMRRRLVASITDDLIAEHRRKPLGQHSDALERLLNYFRRGGLANKIGILRVSGQDGPYRLIRFAGARGQMSQIIDGPQAMSLAEAYHAAFLQRIEDLRASLRGDNQ